MGKAENKIESAVNEYAEKNGFLVRKYTSPNVIGVPDGIYFGYGLVFLIEFKSPKGVLSRAQKDEIQRIRRHGCKVFVVETIEYGKSIFDCAMRAETLYVDS